MMPDDFVQTLDSALFKVIDIWYDRVRPNYVTEEDSREVGLEPELKRFHGDGKHRIKFARSIELDVTYGLGAVERNGLVFLESSVNNKSNGFDYEAFVQRLERYYWSTRSEKPWVEPGYDHYSYSDLLPFEPVLGQSVLRERRPDRAEVIRLFFEVGTKFQQVLKKRGDLIVDLVEDYCLAPLKRIYAESYHEG